MKTYRPFTIEGIGDKIHVLILNPDMTTLEGKLCDTLTDAWGWLKFHRCIDEVPFNDIDSRLKRDNWTNAEVIKILEGMKAGRADDETGKVDIVGSGFGEWNSSIEHCISMFRDNFGCGPDDFGALAYDPQDDRVYHIGNIPKDKTDD